MHAKRWVAFALFGLGATVLGGCPIYAEGRDHRVCLQDGTCYTCPYDYYSSDCYSYSCGSDYDCPNGYSCSSYGVCTSSGMPVYDGGSYYDAGDCSTNGCPAGYVCKLSGGTLQCIASTPTPADSGSDSGFTGCHNNSECPSPTGSKCLNGACVAPQDQCFDTTQCPANEQCVAGVCTPGCGAGQPSCPTGFSCDPKTNVCSGNATPCGATADGGTCTGALVCVEDHCVSPCGTTGSCQAGEVCVAGGCIPDQQAQFTCSKEGTQDACAAGSICIHHACYIACDADAGATACKNADKFNVCKPVTTGTGTYSVCGSTTNLGTDCDPTTGKACAGTGVCIDGFCR